MPRKRRTPKTRLDEPLSDAVVFLLLSGELPSHLETVPGGTVLGECKEWIDAFCWDDEAIEELWNQVRDELLEDWIAEQPGTRPWAWWCCDAPEPERQRVGGIGDLFQGPDVQFGIPRPWSFTWPWQVEYYNGRTIKPEDRCYWNKDFVEGYFTKTAVDPNDRPRFESQATYLDRHGLLTNAERRRLRADAFDPELLSWDEN